MYARLWRVYAAPMKPAPQYLYLGKHMFFASPELAEEFQKHIETLMEKAQHHGHLDTKENQLFYATNTHSARVPVREGHSKDTPGITALDLRIAIRVEALWDKWLEQGKAKLPPPGTTDSGIEVRNIVGFGISALRKSENPTPPSS
ncbi:hypothetical protein PHLGIDRAFT_19929 [Phlebiopsis gigantea 11061_1 CR5-6]|uniref:Uncharacterized protein n=1 Tax=Phlebiopsis gigantea (strain 11061_1 CR5-6) TaxID=745531 RepID=A0A0C3NI98_PHLG1|nr:hypothetical protein PHLGIDRAFT_19929 [Phlebiopsis gigantea 11061_1 CR5-6]